MSDFKTIKSSAEGLYKEKGSKFISIAFPVSSEQETQQCLDEVKKKFHDARHHCYAWVLGMENQTWRANDDGEPNHSAGDPILGQIRSYGLTNTLVVVVRYFGGTKLGVGGLIGAYKSAAEDALSKCKMLTIYEVVQVRLEFPYEILNVVERLVASYEVEVQERDFQLSCFISGVMKKDKLSTFLTETEPLHLLQVTHS